MKKKIYIVNLFLFIFFKTTIVASNNTNLEIDKSFRELSSELRCMVCQNQSLLDSDSELATDLKEIIYKKLKSGKNKKEIKAFLVARYGEFILFKPLFSYSNILLWAAPCLSLLIISLIGLKRLKFRIKK